MIFTQRQWFYELWIKLSFNNFFSNFHNSGTNLHKYLSLSLSLIHLLLSHHPRKILHTIQKWRRKKRVKGYLSIFLSHRKMYCFYMYLLRSEIAHSFCEYCAIYFFWSILPTENKDFFLQFIAEPMLWRRRREIEGMLSSSGREAWNKVRMDNAELAWECRVF